MTTQTKDVLIRGDSQEWTIRLSAASTGLPLPLRSCEVRIVAKPVESDQIDDGDALYVHSATFDADGAIVDPVGIRILGDPDDGVLEEFLTPSDIETLADVYDGFRQRGVRTIARYDLQVLDATGRRKTLISGDLAMQRDVGRG